MHMLYMLVKYSSVGEEDIHAYDLSRLQKPIEPDAESVGTSVKKWPDLSLSRAGQ